MRCMRIWCRVSSASFCTWISISSRPSPVLYVQTISPQSYANVRICLLAFQDTLGSPVSALYVLPSSLRKTTWRTFSPSSAVQWRSASRTAAGPSLSNCTSAAFTPAVQHNAIAIPCKRFRAHFFVFMSLPPFLFYFVPLNGSRKHGFVEATASYRAAYLNCVASG